jgi:hypothetical protein
MAIYLNATLITNPSIYAGVLPRLGDKATLSNASYRNAIGQHKQHYVVYQSKQYIVSESFTNDLTFGGLHYTIYSFNWLFFPIAEFIRTNNFRVETESNSSSLIYKILTFSTF